MSLYLKHHENSLFCQAHRAIPSARPKNQMTMAVMTGMPDE